MSESSSREMRSYATIVTLGTFLVPLAALGCLIAVNASYTGIGLDFASKKWMALFWLCASGLFLYVVSLLTVARLSQDHRADLWLPILGSFIVSAVFFGVLEVAVRILVKKGALGFEFGGAALKPYEWSIAQQHNQELYRRSLADDSFYVGHPRLGWTAGPSRESKDSLYQSSKEGLRSENVGDELLNAEHQYRIALYGDSFIFSEEVAYDESLQFFLDQELSPATQVVNFGMPGYGIDQAYMSFADGADEWKPQVAVLGFIQHDLVRAFDVYTFLRPVWNIPFSKPRFEISGNALKLNNVPNITPTEIFSSERIGDLPFLDLDHNYLDSEWHHNVTHSSMLFRVLASFAPRYRTEGAGTVEQRAELGARIAQAFVTESNNRGVTPLILYLPSRVDFRGDTVLKDRTLSSAKVLGIEVIDLTECLTERVPQSNLFLETGVHYSAAGNRAFASCLLTHLPALQR